MVRPSTIVRISSATVLGALLSFGLAWADGSSPVQSAPAHAKEASQPVPVREVSISPAREVAECHRVRPTGSHIAVMRCVAKADSESPRAAAERALLKKDIDDIKRRQLQQQLLRQQALSGTVSPSR
jgi:hypothetical protein